ncbi:MAG: hypothetical protein ACPGRD_02190 [Planktomarina sp.]
MKIKNLLVSGLLVCTIAAPVWAVEFGDDSSDYSNDGECDDRRFMGLGMATGLDVDDNFHDASDCRKLFDGGVIKLVSESAGRAATQCDVIEFGDNTSEWANDAECDDPRFDGPGVDSIILISDLLSDARDCRSQCNKGNAWLRTPAE